MPSIFGPVHSRRFGVSLGIDLSEGVKQCNFDCLYCELSPAKAIATQQIVTPVDVIVSDLAAALAKHPHVDVITLTANGEPTMYPYLDELITRIDALKKEKQTLILSNSAGLGDPEIFACLLRIDQVKLSLDAATPATFRKIDRPAEGIDIETIIQSIRRFSQVYTGKLFIEVLFVKGVNDTPEEVAALNKALLPVRAERIDIGTVDRPPAYGVQGLSFDELYSLSRLFDPELPVHIVTRSHATAVPQTYSEGEILSTLDKRPLTREDVDALFDPESKERFDRLIREEKIVPVERSNIVFYLPAQNIHRKRSNQPRIS